MSSTVVREVEFFKCLRCGHEWRAKQPEQRPNICPTCKSQKWDTPYAPKPKSHQVGVSNLEIEQCLISVDLALALESAEAMGLHVPNGDRGFLCPECKQPVAARRGRHASRLF